MEHTGQLGAAYVPPTITVVGNLVSDTACSSGGGSDGYCGADPSGGPGHS